MPIITSYPLLRMISEGGGPDAGVMTNAEATDGMLSNCKVTLMANTREIKPTKVDFFAPAIAPNALMAAISKDRRHLQSHLWSGG